MWWIILCFYDTISLGFSTVKGSVNTTVDLNVNFCSFTVTLTASTAPDLTTVSSSLILFHVSMHAVVGLCVILFVKRQEKKKREKWTA